MPRKIRRVRAACNYYLVDANFLVNKYLRASKITDAREQDRIRKSQAWWQEIDSQVASDMAKVYISDLCIAEAFKTLAKKNYEDKIFKYPVDYKLAKDRLRKDIHLPIAEARKQNRTIRYHDIDTSRDVVIGVDRFFELANKLKVNVSIVDLLILATAKYLTDFYGFSDDNLFVVTQDSDLYKLARKIPDLPYTFNPLRPGDFPDKVFV
jgi:hypothetical protein